jgi:excisionase family DNA binding protein
MDRYTNLPPLDPLQRYTVDEAALYLRVSIARIYEKIATGELHKLKDGRRSFIPGADIARLSRAPNVDVAQV